MSDLERHAEAARTTLERILASPGFARAERLSALLRFIVEETLHGRGKRLKAFTIAREVFGRDENFDPRTDSIVRVEVGRLRRRLEHYFLTAGHDEPVIIEIPKGRYSCLLRSRHGRPPEADIAAAGVTPVQVASAPSRTRPWRLAVLAGGSIALLLAVFAGGWLTPRQAIHSPLERSVPGSGRPFLAVLPLEREADDGAGNQLADELVEAIITNLTKVSGMSVMAHASTLMLGSDSLTIGDLRREFGATHALRGKARIRGQNAVVDVHLIEIGTGTTVWGERYEERIEGLTALEDRLARSITTGLAVEIKPDEAAQMLRQHTSDREALALFRQAVLLANPPTDRSRVLAARDMFQRVTKMDPAFAGGYAGASLTYTYWVLFTHTRQPGEDLANAIALARQAVDADPSFGMGYAMLGVALTLARQADEGLRHSRRAVELEPGDAASQAWLAVSLLTAGRPEEAIGPITEALRLDPLEPRTPYLNMLGIALLTAGKPEKAAETFERNNRRGGPTGPHMTALRAVAYAESGREAEGRTAVRELLRTRSDFDVETWFKLWFGADEDLRRSMANLRRLGWPATG